MSFSGDKAFSALMGNAKHPDNVEYIRQQVATISHYVDPSVTAFYNRAQELINTNFSAGEMMYAQQVRSHFAEQNACAVANNMIVELTTMYAVQQASPLMQEYIMACPEIYNHYQRQTIDGFSNTYVDPKPHRPEENVRYREVMDGYLTFNEDDDPELTDDEVVDYTYMSVADDLEMDGFIPLALHEREAVISTWDHVKAMIDTGEEDPTSITGNLL